MTKKKGDWPGPRRYSEIGNKASDLTNKQLGDEISSFTSLTSDELKKLFPRKRDKKEFIKLIKIVNSDASEDEKKVKLISNIGDVSGAVLKLLKRII